MLYQENESKISKDKVFNIIIYIVFATYILLLIKVILFKDVSIAQMLIWDIDSYRSVNIIPFKSIYNYLFTIDMNNMRVFANVFGNLGIFMPLGYLLPLMFSKIRRLKVVLFTSIVTSILFETIQYAFRLGSLDIDDVILNVVGAIAGYGVFCLFKRLFPKKRLFYIVTIGLIIIAALIMSFIIWEEFSDLIGVNRHQTEYVGNENIPTRSADYYGTYKSKNEKLLEIYPNNIVPEDSPLKDVIETVDISIDNKTKLYVNEGKEISKWKSQIIYKSITLNDLKNIEAYSHIEVWLIDKADQNADTIVFAGSIGKSDEISISNQEISIGGIVESISGDIVSINLSTTINTEDGDQIEFYSPDNKNLFKIKLNDQVAYSYMLITESGEILEKRTGQREDIKKGVDLDITGELEDDFMVAKTIAIIEFDE